MKSILVIETPSSCSKCRLKGSCIYWKELIQTPFTKDDKHKLCPLITINIEELEEAIGMIEASVDDRYVELTAKRITTIQDLITKLKGDE